MNKNFVILSFGSNLGDRAKNINQAIDSIISLEIVDKYRVSKMLQTKALLKDGSPPSWNIDYYNSVMSGYTQFSPKTLLTKLKNLEKKIGRVNDQKWAPRLIDIDILFYNDLCFKDEELTIPHPEFLNRNFFINLSAEIAPNYLFPIEGSFYNQSLKLIKKELASEQT